MRLSYLSVKDTIQSSVFLKACHLQKTDYTPIWIMRQAGRYMKEYRDIRSKVGFLELCKTPDLVCEVTVTAVKKICADAAIIFADILLITEPLGFSLEFVEEKGPVIHNPLREAKDLDQLKEPYPRESLSYVTKAIRLTRATLPSNIPLIGFAGAPFTVAAYAIEGGASKNFENTKKLMRSDPKTWNRFMDRISSVTTEYLLAQIEAGADAIQLFDSWIGCLSSADYRSYVLPHVKKIFERLPAQVPQIHFGTQTTHLLREMKEAGGSVMGLDFRVDLDYEWNRLGDIAAQGNLDPTALLCSKDIIKKEAQKILDQAFGKKGHIFNLGHGVLPKTPVDHVRFLIDFVHKQSSA